MKLFGNLNPLFFLSSLIGHKLIILQSSLNIGCIFGEDLPFLEARLLFGKIFFAFQTVFVSYGHGQRSDLLRSSGQLPPVTTSPTTQW